MNTLMSITFSALEPTQSIINTQWNYKHWTTFQTAFYLIDYRIFSPRSVYQCFLSSWLLSWPPIYSPPPSSSYVWWCPPPHSQCRIVPSPYWCYEMEKMSNLKCLVISLSLSLIHIQIHTYVRTYIHTAHWGLRIHTVKHIIKAVVTHLSNGLRPLTASSYALYASDCVLGEG